MSWHNFIFSNKNKDRIKRHLSFWLLWWVYFAATYYYYGQVGLKEINFGNVESILIIKTFILLLVHIASCYFFIYILLPKHFLQKNYTSFAASLLFLAGILIVAGYFIHFTIFPIMDRMHGYDLPLTNKTIWWTNINSVLLNAPKIIAAATGIKLVKRWYVKQNEKERIEKEKLITDLQLLKAQVRPDFLFASLEQIYRYTKRRSPEASGLLLKFSDLLSYMLYECDDAKVPLEKEVAMTKEYMLLEKMRYDKPIETETGVRGDLSGKEIAPLILLPFIENCFRQCANTREQPWINLDIAIDDEALTMRLMNGTDIGSSENELHYKTPEIMNVQKRLHLLYEDNHELKMYADGEIYITVLKIGFKRRSHSGPGMSRLISQIPESLPKYAVD